MGTSDSDKVSYLDDGVCCDAMQSDKERTILIELYLFLVRKRSGEIARTDFLSRSVAIYAISCYIPLEYIFQFSQRKIK